MLAFSETSQKESWVHREKIEKATKQLSRHSKAAGLVNGTFIRLAIYPLFLSIVETLSSISKNCKVSCCLPSLIIGEARKRNLIYTNRSVSEAREISSFHCCLNPQYDTLSEVQKWS